MPDLRRLTVLADGAADLEKAVRQLSSIRVAVGIPAEEERGGGGGSTTRTGSPMTNAVLGYLFEMGSPATNMPARPWLGPGVRESQGRWLPFLQQAGEAAARGDLTAMNKAFNAAGLAAVAAVKSYIQAKIPPPLAPSTIRGRFRRRGLPVPADLSDEDITPLVDTGQFINSISYVVRRPRT
jgi:hypothetical protein